MSHPLHSFGVSWTLRRPVLRNLSVHLFAVCVPSTVCVPLTLVWECHRFPCHHPARLVTCSLWCYLHYSQHRPGRALLLHFKLVLLSCCPSLWYIMRGLKQAKNSRKFSTNISRLAGERVNFASSHDHYAYTGSHLILTDCRVSANIQVLDTSSSTKRPCSVEHEDLSDLVVSPSISLDASSSTK